jgi:P-type E1-E2 ATPase
LQKKLEKVANDIGAVGMVTAVLTFVCMCIRWGIYCFQNDLPFFSMETLTFVLQSFIFAITVIVCAVPEGLPLAVTISLAYSSNDMARKKNLVKQLHASETMGGAHEICSDKTGTLTENRMSVQEIYTGKKLYEGERNLEFRTAKNALLVRDAVVLNSSARVEFSDKANKKVVKGNVTEKGMFMFL